MHSTENVLSVHHWTDRLFSFTTTREPTFRFASGQFVMLGLPPPAGERALMRAYSIASSAHEEHLEFFSIKVPDGPLTSRLQRVAPGDAIVVSRKPTGTLLPAYLLPGERLWMLATGTGLAPFLSLLRDPDVHDAYRKIFIIHGCRRIEDLAYRALLTRTLHDDPFVGERYAERVRYYPTVTREEWMNRGRITQLIDSGKLFRDVNVPPLDPTIDRVMVCGSLAMIRDLRERLTRDGFSESTTHRPGHFAVERAFVD
jgi:ferredoxin--NADP+ reductase